MITDLTVFGYDFPLLRGIQYEWRLKRGWLEASRRAKLTLKGRNGEDRPPLLEDVRILNENGTILTALVDTSHLGIPARRLEDSLDTYLAYFSAYGGRFERLSPSQARFTIEWERRSPPQTVGAQLNSEQNTEGTPVDVAPYRIDLDQAKNGEALVSLNKSLLIGGESESGKSTLVWHMLSQLNAFQIPYRLWVIDPAGGVELNDLQHSKFTRAYVDSAKDSQQLIEDFRDSMYERLKWMKLSSIRTHNITQERPLEILINDELLLTKRAIKDGVDSPFGEVLAAGRKARYIVWALSQIGQKEAIGPIRDLFTQRACLRTRTQETTDAVLGSGATSDGAKCHRIGRPGEGYVWTDSTGKYAQFQAPLVIETSSIAQGGIAAPTIHNDTRTLTETSQQRKQRPHFLYRLYDTQDPKAPPVYIGISDNPKRRFREHANPNKGFPTQIWESFYQSRTEIEQFPNWDQAKAQETKEILLYNPKYNVQERTQ